jgi:prepilin-type processing-associated H-X9-DG protein
MSVTFAAGFVQLVFLLGLGGGFGLPLGIPPGPEDPALAKAAPEECLFYAAWAGTAKPNPRSRNQTEQIMAEPEIQRFAAQVELLVRGVFLKSSHGNPDTAPAADQLVDLVKIAATHPAALFVTSVRPDPRAPDVRGGALVNLGDETDRVRQVLEQLQAKHLGSRAEPLEIGGARWHRIALGRGAPAVAWGIHGKHLVVAVGENEAEAILKRLQGDPPQWTRNVRKPLHVPRTATLTYVNVKAIVELIKPFVPGVGGQVVIEALGLDGVTHFAAVTGLDDTGFTSRSLLGLSEGAGGIFKFISDKPLTAADLAPLPHDATIAAAGRFDLDRAWETSLEILEKLDPDASSRFRAALESAQTGLELNLRDDLLKPLGDVWCVYNSPGEGGLVLTGLTAVVSVKDAQRLTKGHAQLLRVLKNVLDEQRAPPHRRTEVAEFDHAGHKVYYLKTPVHELPIAPAWCLTDKELIVALFPQNVKAYLSRDKGFVSLARRPEVAHVLAAKPGPMKLVYQDTPELFRLGYPLLQIGAKFAVGELRRGGIDVDLAILPSAASIGKHLRPGTIAVTRTAAGIEIVSRQTLPTGNVGASAPVAVALLLPAVQSAREAARRSQSMNNLKQIGLAMHNYHDVYKTFPAAYSTDKEGKPLLSWRVHILPFVEQLTLYRQFHLDEPWDSEHNKKLIGQIPPVYRSPNSRAASGKTNYVTVRSERTIFPGNRAVGMRDITDGTSNTILAVEANDDSAVEWTRPDDFVSDVKNPTKGLTGLRPGGFNVLMADGSVRFLSEGVDAEILRALLTRDGGEVVSPNGVR